MLQIQCQTDRLVLTVSQANATVAVHAISLQYSGPFTALENSGIGHCSHKEQKKQAPHDGLSVGSNSCTISAGFPFKVALKLL